MIRDPNGTLNPIPLKTSQSSINLSPLPLAPPGYVLVQGQNTIKYVSNDPANNTFNFYYRPAYIPYSVNYYMEDGSFPAGSEVYQRVFTEDPPKFGFVGDAAFATSREDMLDALLASGKISQDDYNLYKDGFLYVSPDSLDHTITSNTEGIITADDPATPDIDEGLNLNLYYEARRDIPYTIEYREADTNNKIAEDFIGNDGIILQPKDIGTVPGAIKDIPGYVRSTTDLTLTMKNPYNNTLVVKYTPKPENYTIKHIKVVSGVPAPTHTVFHTETRTGLTGHTVTAQALTAPPLPLGFIYDRYLSADTLSGIVRGDDPTTPENESLVLHVYYSQLNMPYLVEHYTVDNTGTSTLHTKAKAGPSGTEELVNAMPIVIPGYNYQPDHPDTVSSGKVIGLEDPAQDPTAADPWLGLTLKLFYQAATDIPVTIRYRTPDHVTLKNDDTLTGTMGTNVTIPAAAIPGYTVDASEKLHTVTAVNNIVDFIYTPNTDTPYTIRYYAGTEVVGEIAKTGTTGEIVTAEQTPLDTETAEKLTGYYFNAAASTMNGTILGDGSLVLQVFYSAGNTEYVEEFYLPDENGAYSGAPIIEKGMAETDSTVSFSMKEIPGYSFDAENPNNIMTDTVAGDGTTVLRGYYTANTDTPFTAEYYLQDALGADTYTEINADIVSGTTGTAPSPIPARSFEGYVLNANKTVASPPLIQADGSTVIRYYFDLEEIPVQVEYYISEASFNYPEDPDITMNDSGVIGYPFTPKPLTDQEGYENYAGFKIDTGLSWIPTMITGENQVVKVYYRALDNRPYTVQHFTMEPGSFERLRQEDKLVDGITTASIKVEQLAMPPEVSKGYTYDPTRTYATLGGAPYTEPGILPIQYPNISLEDSRQLILKLYYVPNTDTPYKIAHYIPTDSDTYEMVFLENKTAPTGTYVFSDPADGTMDSDLQGYVFDSTHLGNVRMSRVEGDGTTLLKLYYKARTDTPYTIQAYMPMADGSYGIIPSHSIFRQGTTDTVVYATTEGTSSGNYPSYEGYAFDATHPGNITEATLAGDGSTALRLYYKTLTDVPYTVNHYFWTPSGYILQDSESLTGETNKAIAAEPKIYLGYAFDETVGIHNGTIRPDGSLVLSLYYNPRLDIGYREEIYLQNADGTWGTEPSSTLTKQARTKEVIYGTAPNIEFYDFDPDNPNNILRIEVAGDGSSILKYYYTAQRPAVYTVHYIYQEKDAEGSVIAEHEVAPSKFVEPTDSHGEGLRVGSIIKDEVPPAISGYHTPPKEEFRLMHLSNSFTYYYTLAEDQVFDYRINYFRLVPAGDPAQAPWPNFEVPGTQVVEGKATVGSIIPTAHPDPIGYKVAANQPTQLVVKGQDADPEDSKSLDPNKYRSNTPGANTVNVFYIVDLDQKFPYELNYQLENGNPLPGMSPNPIIGTGSAEETIQISHYAINGYRIKPDPIQPTSFAITPGDADAATPGNQLIPANTITITYEPDSEQTYNYRVNHYLANPDGTPTTTPVPGKPSLTGRGTAGEVVRLDTAAPPGYKFAHGPSTLTVTTDNLSTANLYYQVDDAQKYPYTIQYYIEGTTDPVPGIDQTPGAGNATPSGEASAGTQVAITHPILGNGYRVSANQPTRLRVGTNPADNMATVYYSKDATQLFDYSISYRIQGIEEPLPGISPNPITGQGVIGQTIAIQKPLVNGYKPVDPTDQSLVIDGVMTGNNHISVDYVRDAEQYAGYTIRHVALDGPQAGTMSETVEEGLIGESVQAQATDFDGYVYEPTGSTPSGVVTAEHTLVLTLNYREAKALSYTVVYKDLEGNAIAEPVVMTDGTWEIGETLTFSPLDPDTGHLFKSIPGFRLQSDVERSLTLGNTGNKLDLYYEAVPAEYTVRYLKADSTETVLKNRWLRAPMMTSSRKSHLQYPATVSPGIT